MIEFFVADPTEMLRFIFSPFRSKPNYRFKKNLTEMLIEYL